MRALIMWINNVKQYYSYVVMFDTLKQSENTGKNYDLSTILFMIMSNKIETRSTRTTEAKLSKIT